MIVHVSLSLRDQVCYRMHSPKWSWAPTSGAGAARQGGRLNRDGVEALYLGLEDVTAISEYRQTSPLLPPGTLVSYQITLDKVVDFRGGYTKEWDPIWQDLQCDWRKLRFADHVEPPSWVIADLCMAEGYKGILFQSTLHPGGNNLVLFNSTLGPLDRLVTYDPFADLPKNQSSWT